MRLDSSRKESNLSNQLVQFSILSLNPALYPLYRKIIKDIKQTHGDIKSMYTNSFYDLKSQKLSSFMDTPKDFCLIPF